MGNLYACEGTAQELYSLILNLEEDTGEGDRHEQGHPNTFRLFVCAGHRRNQMTETPG